jgi:hypothetical protein
MAICFSICFGIILTFQRLLKNFQDTKRFNRERKKGEHEGNEDNEELDAISNILKEFGQRRPARIGFFYFLSFPSFSVWTT